MNGKIILAGATGYLGGYIVRELQLQGYDFIAFARNTTKLAQLDIDTESVMKVEVTDPASFPTLNGQIDTVISTVGITRQKDGLTYMDVDYQANMNLLAFAKRHQVRKFIYVSVLHGDKMRQLKITAAKERFVDALQASGLDYTIVRPNGFFSDMKDFLDMAKSGRVYLFGDGEYKLNPIHGRDLAKVILELIPSLEKMVEVGGPDIYTQNEIAALALRTFDKPEKITHLPDWIRRAIIRGLTTLLPAKTYGPYEFFLTMMGQDNIAPRFGIERLPTFFREVNDVIDK